MYTNKEIEINGKKIVLYHNSKTGLIGIISGDIGDILCDVNGKVKGKVTGSVGGVGGSIIGDVGKSVFGSIGGEVSGNIKGNVMGTIYGYVKGSITKYVGINVGNVYGSVMGKITGNVGGNIGGDVQGTIFGSVMGSIIKKVMGNVGSLMGKVMDEVKTDTDTHTDPVGSDYNEQIENKKGDDMKDGDSFFESVIDGIKELTFEQKFMNGAKFAIENNTGTNYAFNPPSTMSLEKGYKQLLTTKKETGTNDLNQYIDYYEDVFYQEVFIYAINESLKYGLGVNHKFTVNEVTLQSYYMKSLMEKAIGKKEYDICIKSYEHAFIDKDNEDYVEDNIKNKKGDKMEQAESGVKMNELGSLQYMYERMQQIRQGKRDGYVNKLDEALDSFEAIMLAEENLYQAVHNCKDGTDNHKSTETHNHTETEKVTDTVTTDKGKKKDGGKEEDGGKKATNELEDKYEPLKPYPIDDEDTNTVGDKHIPTFEDMFNYKFGRSQPEVTNNSREDLDAEEIETINALIDKVEDAEKDGDGVTNDAQIVDKQQLQKLYGGMLRTQLEGSEKYNPCIIKYQDTFPVHAFIVAVNMASEIGDGIEYKFGKVQRKLSSVYREMHALKHTYGSDEWDICIKAYKATFPIAGEDYAFKQETNFYLKRKK